MQPCFAVIEREPESATSILSCRFGFAAIEESPAMTTPSTSAPTTTPMKKVTAALDRLIDAAAPHQGLIPSLLDLDGRGMLRHLPPAIDGQRDGDRSFPGSNLSHDVSVLHTLYGLADALDRPACADAADRYLQRFATHCTTEAATPTGLFPWGEHSFWNLVEDRAGNSYILNRGSAPIIHDHLLQAPQWLWEKLWVFNPRCVERFAEGLDLHYVSDERCEYIRHAPLLGGGRPAAGVGTDKRSCDFPRHGGFYLYDWTFALLRTQRDDLRQNVRGQIERMLDYWWNRRDPRNLVFSETRTPPDIERHYRVLVMSQGLSLAASLLEAAAMRGGEGGDESDLAEVMRERGRAYLDGFLSVPHDLDVGRFVSAFPADRPEELRFYAIWGSVYGTPPAAASGLMALCCYRLTNNEAALRYAEAVGRAYAAQPFPEDVAVPVKDAGSAIELLVDLADLTGEGRFLDDAASLAARMMPIYFDQALPRAAAGVDYYESQCLPGYFLHALARLAVLRDGGRMEPDYTLR